MTSISLLPCVSKQLFGISCPLCGFQRAVVLLCNGQVWDSIRQFPPLPIMALWGVCFVSFAIAGKAHFFLYNRWPWIILLTSLFANAIYQNIFY